MTYESEPVTYLTGNDPAPEEPGEGAEPEEWAKYFEQKFVYDLDNYEAPKGMTEAQPMNFYDMDAYVESVKPDFETKPKGLEDVKLTYEFMIYQPYVGLFLKDKMQPNQKVRVTLQVDDLNLTETQMEFMKNLVGNRYKPRKNTLSFVSRKSDNVKDNMEHVKKLLSNVIAEIRKH